MSSDYKNEILGRLTEGLMDEYAAYATRERSPSTEKYRLAQATLFEVTKTIGQKGNITIIIETERTFLENEYRLYGNSKSMRGSLDAALHELSATERLVNKVQSPEGYAETNQAHSLLKNRVGCVPKDEARQFFRSHSARLLNQDKSRLTETEKRIVEARRNNLRTAEKAYIAMQRRTLGLPIKAKERGQDLSR